LEQSKLLKAYFIRLVIEIGINQLPCSHKPKIGDLSLLAVEMLRLVKALRKLNGKAGSKIN